MRLANGEVSSAQRWDSFVRIVSHVCSGLQLWGQAECKQRGLSLQKSCSPVIQASLVREMLPASRHTSFS